MDVQPGSEFKNIVPPHQRATYEAHQLISAAASHFKRAFNIAVKFAVGYRLSGGLRVLTVVIAARVWCNKSTVISLANRRGRVGCWTLERQCGPVPIHATTPPSAERG